MVIVVASVLTFIHIAEGVNCRFGYYTGTPHTATGFTESDNLTNFGILAESYNISCCGLISSFYVNARKNGTIRLQTWRPGDKARSTDYTLTSSLDYNITQAPGYEYILLDYKERIRILPDDILGWESENGIVGYKDGDGTYFVNNNITGITVGRVYATRNAIQYSRTYGVTAFLRRGSTPTFTNLPATMALTCAESIGDVLYSVAGEETVVTGPLTYANSSQGNETNYFSIRQNGDVKLAALPSPGKYDLSVMVSAHCDISNTEILTVTTNCSSFQTHTTTSIAGMKTTTSIFKQLDTTIPIVIGGNTSKEDALYVIRVGHDENITCFIASSGSGADLFELIWYNETSTYQLHFIATDWNQDLNVTLELQCVRNAFIRESANVTVVMSYTEAPGGRHDCDETLCLHDTMLILLVASCTLVLLILVLLITIIVCYKGLYYRKVCFLKTMNENIPTDQIISGWNERSITTISRHSLHPKQRNPTLWSKDDRSVGLLPKLEDSKVMINEEILTYESVSEDNTVEDCSTDSIRRQAQGSRENQTDKRRHQRMFIQRRQFEIFDNKEQAKREYWNNRVKDRPKVWQRQMPKLALITQTKTAKTSWI